MIKAFSWRSVNTLSKIPIMKSDWFWVAAAAPKRLSYLMDGFYHVLSNLLTHSCNYIHWPKGTVCFRCSSPSCRWALGRVSVVWRNRTSTWCKSAGLVPAGRLRRRVWSTKLGWTYLPLGRAVRGRRTFRPVTEMFKPIELWIILTRKHPGRSF